MNIKKISNRRFFTLLEVMIGIALIALASSLIGVKMHHAIEKKRFQSTLESLKARIMVTQKLAISTQDDWQLTLEKKGHAWTLHTVCENKKKLSPLHFQNFDVYLNGKKVDCLTLDFFSTGEVLPNGKILLKDKSQKAELKIAELVLREEGKKQGPLYPSD